MSMIVVMYALQESLDGEFQKFVESHKDRSPQDFNKDETYKELTTQAIVSKSLLLKKKDLVLKHLSEYSDKSLVDIIRNTHFSSSYGHARSPTRSRGPTTWPAWPRGPPLPPPGAGAAGRGRGGPAVGSDAVCVMPGPVSSAAGVARRAAVPAAAAAAGAAAAPGTLLTPPRLSHVSCGCAALPRCGAKLSRLVPSSVAVTDSLDSVHG